MKVFVSKRGFTLIELLVVIAIIGILAGIVLASLGGAKEGGNDAKIKSQLSAMRSQAELYNGTGAVAFPAAAGTTCPATAVAADNTLFDDTNNGFWNLLTGVAPAETRCASEVGKPSTGAKWAVAALINNNNSAWCVDYRGVSRGTTIAGVTYTTTAAAIANGALQCTD